MNSTASVGEFIKYLENVGFVVDTRAAKDLHFCFYNALRVPSIHQAHLVSSLLKRNSVLIVDKDTLAWNPGAVFLPADIHKKVTETLLQSADMNNCFNYLRFKHPVINNESKYAVENIKKIVNETSTKRTTAGYVNGATKSKTEHHYDTTTEFQYLDGLKLTSSKPSETSMPTIEIIEYQQAQLNANQEVPKSSIVITIKYDDTSVETTENTKKNIDETTTENLQFPLEDQQYNTFQSTLKEYETPQESTVAVEIYSVEYDLPVTTTISTTNELNVAETESDKNSEVTTKYPRLTVDSSTQHEILKEYKTSGESTTEFLDLSTETSTYPSRAATESTTSFGKIETEIANVYEVTTDIEHESSEITITTYDTFTAETTSDLYDSTVYKDISHAPRGGNPTLSIDTTTALDESIEDHHDEPYETEINQKIFSVETTSLSINKELHSTGYGLSVETTLIPLEVITVTHDSTIVPTVDHLFVKETTILPEIVKEFASITEASGEENTDLPHTTKEFHEIVRETNTDPIETTTEGMKELEYVLGEEDMKFSTEVTVNTDLTDIFNSISEEHVKELQTSTIEMTTELDHGTDLKDSLFSNDKATVLPNYNRESISTPNMPTIEYEKSFTESTTFIPELVEKKSISKTDESILEHSTISLETTTDIPAMKGFDNIPDEPNPKNPSSIEKTTTSPEFTSEFYNSPQTVVMEYQTSSIQTDVPETFKILYNIADEPTFEYNYLASTETTTNPHEVKDFYSNLHESNQDNAVASVEETTIQQVLNEIHTTPYVATTEFQTFSDETTTIQHQVVKSQNNVADDASTENNLFSIETTTDLLETLELHNISHESNLNNDMILAGNRNMQETTVEYATPTDSQPFAIEITTIVPEINNDPKQAGDETGIEQTMSSFDTTLWPEKEERSLNVLRKSRMNHHIYSVETTTDLPQTEVYDISYKTNQEHTTISGDVVTSLSEITTDTADALPISTVDNKIFTFETTVLPEMNDFKSIEHELFNEGPNVANTAQDYDTERSVTSEYDVRQIDISTRTMPNEAITESDITFQGTIGTETDYIEISTVYNKILTETTENYDEMQFEMTSRTNDKTVFEFVDDNPPTSTLEVRLTENFQDVTTEGLRIETTAVDNAPVTSNEYSENTNEYIVPELNDNTYETTTNYDQLDESVTTNIPYQKMFHTSEDTFKQQDFVNVLDTLALERSAVENSSTKSFNENHSESDGENDDKLFPVISFHGDNIQFLDSLIPGDLNQMLENFQTRIMDDNLNLVAKSNQDNSDETESNSESDRDTSTNNLITTESTEAKPIFNVIRRSVNYLNVPNFNITEGGDSVLFPGQKANISDTSGTNHVLRTMLNDTPALYYEYKKVSELQNVFTEDDAGVTGLSLLNSNQDDSLNTKEKSESDITTEKLEESEVTEFNFVVTTDIPFLSYDNGTADTTEERKLEKAVTLDGENVVDTTISEGIIRRENILEQGSNIPPINPIVYFEVITAIPDNPESTTFSSVDNERNWQTTVFPTRESDGIFTTDAFMELSSTEQESPNQDAQTEVPDLEFLTSVLPSFTTEEKVIDFKLTPDEHILMNKI
ncbi:hypothetical protein C0J52_25586 [Blattella germanica]|nr:hypothetical protein C0J52_25586 [Blattella germanica]